MTPEGKIKRKVVEMLRKYGVWYFFPGNNGFGKSGIPDIIAIAGGLFIGIECKADPKKKPTELQRICGEQIQAAGGSWFLVRCEEDISEVEKCLLSKVPKHLP
jgi:Holliday junction resolvase